MKRRLDKIRWQVKVPRDVAESFDAIVPPDKTRSDELAEAMRQYIRKVSQTRGPQPK